MVNVAVLKNLICGALFLFSASGYSLCPNCHPYKEKKEHERLCDPCFKWSDVLSFKAGFLGDYIFNRELEYRQGRKSGGVVEETQIFSQGCTLSLLAQHWFHWTLFLGSTSIEISTPAEANAYFSTWEFKPHFSWSLECGANLVRTRYWSVYINGQYFSTHSKLDSYFDYGGAGKFHFDNEKAGYRNWQVGLGSSYEITSPGNVSLIPYITMKYSEARLHLSGNTFTHEGTTHFLIDLQNRKTLGYGLGVIMKLDKKIAVGVENRLADDRALMVSGEILF